MGIVQKLLFVIVISIIIYIIFIEIKKIKHKLSILSDIIIEKKTSNNDFINFINDELKNHIDIDIFNNPYNPHNPQNIQSNSYIINENEFNVINDIELEKYSFSDEIFSETDIKLDTNIDNNINNINNNINNDTDDDDDDINIKNKSISEVYSNEKKTNNETSSLCQKKEDNKIDDDIILNLQKYKLPELQDIAMQYKINLSINNKKKNKTQLIDDIKKYAEK
jgi:hypothetical protein